MELNRLFISAKIEFLKSSATEASVLHRVDPVLYEVSTR